MFTHICVFVLWTFGDIFGLFARCDFDLPQEVRKIHEKLLKSTVFFEINKMFLWCLLQYLMQWCFCHFSSLSKETPKNKHHVVTLWVTLCPQFSGKSFQLTSLVEQPFKYRPPHVMVILSTPDHPFRTDMETCFLAGNTYLSNEVRNSRGHVEPEECAVMAVSEAGSAGLTVLLPDCEPSDRAKWRPD